MRMPACNETESHHLIRHKLLVLFVGLVGVLGGVVAKVFALELLDRLLHRHVALCHRPVADFPEVSGDFHYLPVARAVGR